jgi:hypothetical protein
MARRSAAQTADKVGGGRRCPCAKLRVVAVIVIAEMFGISGRRAELGTLLERFGSWAGGQPGCRRYIFAATVTTQRDTMAMTDDDVFGWRRELDAIDALLERLESAGRGD